MYDGDITWGDISATTTVSTFTPGSNIPFDRIYWRVRSVDNVGNKSAWSTEFWFDLVDNVAPSVPPLLSPADGSRTASSSVALDWNDSTDSGTGVDNYEVQVDDSSSFASPNYNATPGSSSATTSALSDGVYYWRVRAKDNANNWSAWSSPRTFRVDTTAPTVPTLLAPVNGSSTGDQTPTFDWTDSSDGGSGMSHYEVEVYDGDITWGDISTTVTASAFTPGGNIPFDRIYWKIRAVDNVGNKSAWSTEFWFDLVNNAPTQPGVITPANVTSNSASIAWVASTDSDGDSITYEVEYGVNNTPGWTSAGSTTSTSRNLSGLASATTYVVRVRAIDGKGGISSWRELDPAFTTRAVTEIVSAYWLLPLTVPEGTLVTMRAEVYGYTAGTSFNFTIYEDDGLLNDDRVTNLTGIVYATNGTFYVDASWITKWQNDQSGGPEFYFEAASGGVSKKSGKSAGEELVITTRRVWHASGFTESRVVTPAGPTVPLNWSANDRPSGARVAQVAFIWDLSLGSYADNELELTCYGPGWSKSRTIRVANANRQSEISFDRDAFPDGFSADSGEWGVRVENMTAGKGNVTFTRLDIVITHFTSLIENPLPSSPNNNRKVVVMIHGWNPNGLTFAQHYGGNWATLSDALIAAKNATTGWDVTRYNWVEDAATGTAGVNSQVNSVASRDAAVAHGLHLGKEVESKYPNLEKVQLIAHSAGNWAARGAARYLKGRFPNADIQVTSLDAFIPNAPYALAVMPSNLKMFEEMGRGGWTPKILDNYYVVDVGTLWNPDSDVVFRQTSLDFAGWSINRQLDADGNYAPLYDNATMNEHSGPILWYGRSVEACNAGNSATLGGLGFSTSLMFTEPHAQIVSITPNPAQPPQDNISFQGSGAVNGASISAYEWSSSLNGVIGSTATFSKQARELTVASHTISFRARDSQGNWSSPVTANLTVNNAIPTASMAGVPSVPVSPGAVVNLTLGGQDNDENNQAVVAGELSVGGTVVANPTGSYNLTAPTQPGNYTISYRVQDDEGSWSASTNKTLTVQDAQGPTLNITCQRSLKLTHLRSKYTASN